MNPKNSRKRITDYSRVLKIILFILMIILPLTIIGQWVFIDKLPNYELYKYTGNHSFTVGCNTQIFGAVASLLPAFIVFLLAYNGYRLFSLYEQGKILTQKNVHYFRLIGILFIVQAVVSIIMKPVFSLIMTMNNMPGQHSLTISLASNDIVSVCSGLFIIVIGWVMDEARKINEEIELTI